MISIINSLVNFQPVGYSMGRLWKFKKDEVDEWVKAGGTTAEENKQDAGDKK